MKTVHVELGNRSYDILIGSGLLSQIGKRTADLVKGRQAAVVTDSQVGPLYAAMVENSLRQAGFRVQVITIPCGESSKSWAMAEEILTILLKEQFHRDSSIIALGGGVVGDLAGFAASIYQRGINFFQVPTSLLAQVDSSVGGKVAVNHALGKNMIGSFYQPKAVWIDLDALQTLEERHWKNGLAEVIKYGVISSMPLFTFLSKEREAILARKPETVAEVIALCCRLKAEVVALDETEKGVRAQLNYGHTIGHGLEIASHYTGYLHGEAVAVGMALAAEYASAKGICNAETALAICQQLSAYGLPVALEKELSVEAVLNGMALDKKIQDGQWVFILPEAIGRVQTVKGVSQTDIRQLLMQSQKSGKVTVKEGQRNQ